MSDPLWFFWGGNHLTFLRWMTLKSASLVHDNVILVRRENDQALHESEMRASKHWHEHQDFQMPAIGKNWIDRLPPTVKQIPLHEIALDLAELAAPDVQTSDLLGWKLLAEQGGTVADMDVLFIRPLPVITAPIQMVVCTGWPKAGYMPIGFLQGRPCEFWREMYQRAREAYNPTVYESCGAGRFPASWDEIPEPKALLSERVVYPFALKGEWMQWHPWMFERNDYPEIPEDCCGVHWYGGMNQSWNMALTADNVATMPGAVPAEIRRILAACA
jgi:hypothetical protein